MERSERVRSQTVALDGIADYEELLDPQREPLRQSMGDRCSYSRCTKKPTTRSRNSHRSELLVGCQSLKCIGVNFCCTAANITATLAASMALPADTDDDTCEGPAAKRHCRQDRKLSSGHGI